MRKLPKWKLAVIGLLSLMVVMFIAALYRLATNPEGRYLFDQVGRVGLTYMEFKEGKVYFVCIVGDDVDGEEESRRQTATYAKVEGGWIVTGIPGFKPETLEPGVLSFKTRDASGKVASELPRMWVVGNKVVRVYRP